MKRAFLSAFMAVLLVACLPMTAFAAVDYKTAPPISSWVHGDHTDLGIFDVASLSVDKQAIWNDMMAHPSNYIVLQRFFYSESTGLFTDWGYIFYYYPDGTTFSVKESTSVSKHIAFIPPSGSQVHTFSVSPPLKDLSNTFKALIPITHSSSSNMLLLLDDGRKSNGTIFYSRIIGGVWGNAPVDSKFINLNRTGSLYIVDNLNPEPEPPDPPPTPPTPPDPEQPPLEYPTFPKVEGDYIAYDTTIWNSFADRIRSSIGSAANIGLQLLAIILGIYVVIKIIRLFSGVRHHGGD